MHPYDDAVEWVKSHNDVREAREWLTAAGRDYGVIHELSHEEGIEVVDASYSRGAIQVDVVGTLSDKPGESSVDMLLITLPENKKDRELLFDLEEQIAAMTGFERSIDEGQNYILLRWT
jgi:hypothetical protein